MITRARASALLLAGSAFGAIGLPGAAQSGATVSVGAPPQENAAEAYFAKDMGFFSKAGLDADIQPMTSGSASAAAVTSSAVDIGFSDLVTIATIHSKNIPLVIIAPAAEYLTSSNRQIEAMLIPISSLAQQGKDVNGKVVAVNSLRSLGEIAARAWIDSNGGDSSTVKFIEIPFPAMTPALAAGRADAAFLTEPFIGAGRKNARVLGYGLDGIGKHFSLGAWFTTPQWAKAHPDLVNRFAATIRETAVWANNNPVKSGEILAKYTKIDPAIVATMTRAHFSEQMTAALLQPLIDASAKYNGFNTFPAQDLILVGAH